MSDPNEESVAKTSASAVEAPSEEAKKTSPDPSASSNVTENDKQSHEQPIEHDWKAEYLSEVSQSRKYRQRAQGAEAEIEKLTKRALSEEQMAKYLKLRQLAGQMADKTDRIKNLEAMVRCMTAKDELNKALVACGVGSGCPHGEKMLSQAASLLAGRIKADFSNGDNVPVVHIVDETGNILQDNDKPLTVHQFVSRWLAEEGSHFLPASQDSGSGAHVGHATPADASIEQLDRNPKAKAQFIAKHGPQAYVQLARKKK